MRQVPGIGFGISIFIVMYALAVYLEPLNHKSSTEGLVYVFCSAVALLPTSSLVGSMHFGSVAFKSVNRDGIKRETDQVKVKNNLEKLGSVPKHKSSSHNEAFFHTR